MPYNIKVKTRRAASIDDDAPQQQQATTPQTEAEYKCTGCGRRSWCAVDATTRDSDGLPFLDVSEVNKQECSVCGAACERTGRYKVPDVLSLKLGQEFMTHGHGTSEQVYKVHLPELTVRW